MYHFNFNKITSAHFAGKAGDPDCFVRSSGAGGVRKEGNGIRDIVQNIGETALICTAKRKRNDLSIRLLNTCFYKVQRKFAGAEDKTGGEFMSSEDKFVICLTHKVSFFLWFPAGTPAF